MKTIDKNRFPEMHINPINRDLLLVVILALLVALSVSTVAAMLVSRV